MPDIFTTAEVAELLEAPLWQIQRLFSEGTLPEVGRFAGKRKIPRSMIPKIIDAMRARGWLQEESPARAT